MISDDRQNNFDLIRLIAALQVLAMHGNYWLDLPIVIFGDALAQLNGVPIFFFSSGFLIAGSLLRKPELLDYSKRRAARIYPALIVMMLVVFVQLAAFGIYTIDARTVAHTLWTTLSGWFTLANLTIPVGNWPAGFPSPYGVVWTIAVELQFYVLLPLLIRRPWLLTLAAVASLALAFWIVPMRNGDSRTLLYLLDTTSPSYAWMFLLGALARLHWPNIRKHFDGKALQWLIFYFAFWQTMAWLGWSAVPEYKFITPASLVGLLLLFALVLAFAHTAPRLSSWLKGVDLSYGIYLWHMPVICTAMFYGWSIGWVGLLTATLGLAALSWFLVERPAIAWARRRADNGEKVPAVVVW